MYIIAAFSEVFSCSRHEEFHISKYFQQRLLFGNPLKCDSDVFLGVSVGHYRVNNWLKCQQKWPQDQRDSNVATGIIAPLHSSRNMNKADAALPEMIRDKLKN